MLCTGIDWSDKSLDYHLRTIEGNVLDQGQVTPNAEGMSDLFTSLEIHGCAEEIGIAIETAHGAWVQALLDRGYQVYPVNPKTVECFREALSANGEKTDEIDGRVLAMFLATFHRKLKPLRPDAPEIIALRVACQDRLRLVEEHTAKLNELQSILKCHYPAFMGLFGNLNSKIALAFLKQFPTQDQMRSLSQPCLLKWLKRHHYTCIKRFDDMANLLQQPVLPVAPHLQQAKKPLIRYLVGSLENLNAEIAKRNAQITDDLDKLPEADWIRSLPGAGEILAPALLACLGRDPDRFDTIAEARALMGTAPVTKASGRSKIVYFRRGCWKFGRRTLQLFADKSRFECEWAQVFYQKQRNLGHKHHAALRALAHKWLKILLAIKRSGIPYDDTIFSDSQKRYLLNKSLVLT